MLDTGLYDLLHILLLKLLFVPLSCSPAVSHTAFSILLKLSLNWLFLQVTCFYFLWSFATLSCHILKDSIFLNSIDGIHFGFMSTAVMRFHVGRAAITWGLALYSWRAPGIQEAPFAMQLPLHHTALSTVADPVAWGVFFCWPRND
jgi:hypothetical protein